MTESDKNKAIAGMHVKMKETKKKRRYSMKEWLEKIKQGTCQDCKWWIEQGPRTKDVNFELTLVGWCKRMPKTEMDKDKDDWCGEFEPR